MVDTLITIGIIAFVLLRAYRKSQKKTQQHSQRKPTNSPFPQPTVVTEPVWEEMVEEESGYKEEEVSSSYEEIPKNQPYFTYETFEPEIKSDEVVADMSSEKSVEKIVQNTDSENEKLSPISLDMEDIYKGVIYSEILKRPYN